MFTHLIYVLNIFNDVINISYSKQHNNVQITRRYNQTRHEHIFAGSSLLKSSMVFLHGEKVGKEGTYKLGHLISQLVMPWASLWFKRYSLSVNVSIKKGSKSILCYGVVTLSRVPESHEDRDLWLGYRGFRALCIYLLANICHYMVHEQFLWKAINHKNAKTWQSLAKLNIFYEVKPSSFSQWVATVRTSPLFPNPKRKPKIGLMWFWFRFGN